MWAAIYTAAHLFLAVSAARTLLTEEFLTQIDKARVERGVKGLTIALVHDGVTEIAAQGIRTEHGQAMTEDTLFHIASCSKSFVAAAMGLLIDDFERGANVTTLPPGVERFDWHSKMKDILPGEWKLMDPMSSDNANVHDILSHVTGLPSHDEVITMNETAASLLKNLRNLRPSYELRERWSYSNLMYTVAAYVISKYSNQPYIDFVQRRLFDPMDMTSTSFSPSDKSNLTSTWIENGRLIPEWLPTDKGSLDVGAGPGGVISNSIDLARYLTIMLNRGAEPASGHTVIPEHVWTAVTSPYAALSGTETYAMGWIISSYRDIPYTWHTGHIPGYSSLLLWVPSQNQGFSLLMNGNVATELLQPIQFAVLDTLWGLKHASLEDIIQTSPPSQQALLNLKARADQGFSPLDPRDLTGTYSALGYSPSITLCAASSHSSDDSLPCSTVLSIFATLEPLNSTYLYASWPNVWISHVRLTPQADHTYNFEETQLFPHGYGKDASPFELVMTSQVATFDVVDGTVRGFGLSDRIEQPTLRRGKGVEESSVVWFGKVESM